MMLAAAYMVPHLTSLVESDNSGQVLHRLKKVDKILTTINIFLKTVRSDH